MTYGITPVVHPTLAFDRPLPWIHEGAVPGPQATTGLTSPAVSQMLGLLFSVTYTTQ